MQHMYPELDRSHLQLKPLCRRRHLMGLEHILPLTAVSMPAPELLATARAIHLARRAGAPVVLMMGAHVVRAGVQRFLIDLMERGFITCLAGNGATVIHDFELAYAGGTTESVAHYIRDGSFGFWQETGKINDIVSQAHKCGMGLGEAVGQAIENDALPHRQLSLLASATRLGLPFTVHVGIGMDIVHQLPNCDGAAYGATSMRDFLRLAQVLEGLEQGVFLNFGSAVTGPEVFLKALSMARNLARQQGRSITRFTTLVCDLVKLPADYRNEAARDDAAYYFRPWKTLLLRTVAGGGQSYYLRGDHRETIPALWSAVNEEEAS